MLDLSQEDYIGRELLLIKLPSGKDVESEVDNLGGMILFKNQVLLNAQFVGTSEEVDNIISILEKVNPLEVVRTGLSGLSSTSKTLNI